MKKKIEYEESSGNVFADLQLPNPEELLINADLTIELNKIIKQKKLSQKRAALLLGVSQSKIAELMSDKFPVFSVAELLHFLNHLGHEVTIEIKPKQAVEKPISKKAIIRHSIDPVDERLIGVFAQKK